MWLIKPMTTSRAGFEHITLYTCNVAAIFFSAISMYGVLPYSMIRWGRGKDCDTTNTYM